MIENKETLEKVMAMGEEAVTNYMTQRMLNEYRASENLPSISEILRGEGKEEQPGVLDIQHIKGLKGMVRGYYKSEGKDLEAEAKERGIELKEDEISPIEAECIANLLQSYNETIINENKA